MRWLKLVIQSIGLGVLGLGFFILTHEYPQLAPDWILVNRLLFFVALCFLLIVDRSPTGKQVKVAFAIGAGAIILGLSGGLLFEGGGVWTLLLLGQIWGPGAFILAVGYAIALWAFLHWVAILFRARMAQ